MQIQRRQYKDTINTNTLIQIYKVEGGDLEIIRMEKHAGMDALVDYHDINNPIISLFFLLAIICITILLQNQIWF